MKPLATATISALLGAGAMYGATLEPAPVLKTATLDTKTVSTKDLSEAYAILGNSLGVTIGDITDSKGNLQLVISEKLTGTICK